MSRKNRPRYHEPTEAVPVSDVSANAKVPAENTQEVGAII